MSGLLLGEGDHSDVGHTRFIKRVPTSGGAPSFKLSLNYGVVKSKLSHLVNSSFQLASSSESQQTWEASISPRRNKDRSEFVLQGWKLFALAHNLRAGDQVSFELVSPRRMVVKCIQSASSAQPNSLARSVSERTDVDDFPPHKSSKITPCSSPSRPRSLAYSERAASLIRSDIPAMSPCAPSSAGRMSAPNFPTPNPLAHRVQSWLSLDLPSSQGASPLSPGSRVMHSEPSALSGSITPRASAEAAEHADFSDFDEGLPGIFEDMCGDLDSVVPDLPTAMRFAADGEPNPAATCPTACHAQFQTHPFQKEPEMQSSETELRALVSNIQDRLDHSTRSALRATMGLENCAVDLSNIASQRNARDVQARMFTFLSTLKESLWQILLTSVESGEAAGR